MKILLYTGGRGLVEGSGVGRAICHQEAAMAGCGISFTENPDEEYDIVHINTVLPDARRMAGRARRAGKKVVCHGHSTQEDFRNSFIGSNRAAGLFRRWLVECYSQADLVLTPTEYSRRLLASYGLKNPIVPLSNGVDTEFFRKEPGQRERFRKRFGFTDANRVVLCVGLPIERKGILDVISLAWRFPGCRFVWCGAAPRGLLPRHIRQAMAHAPENLCFAGFLNREELRDAYGGSDLFLFPTWEETEGIVLLEALSMELPVLTRDIPVYEGWLGDGREVWKASGKQEFALRIRSFLEGELPDLSAAGRRIAEERDIKIIGQRLATLYRTLL